MTRYRPNMRVSDVPGVGASLVVAPPGGWITVMTESGRVVHLLDPQDVDVRPPDPRYSMCGVHPVYPAPHPLVPDPLRIEGLCVRCRRAAEAYRPERPAGAARTADAAGTADPDPMLRLLRAAGLGEEQAATAAGIARGWLAAEFTNAIARAQVEAQAAGGDGPKGPGSPDRDAWRNLAAGLSWARDVVYARRMWPPQPLDAPPGPPQVNAGPPS